MLFYEIMVAAAIPALLSIILFAGCWIYYWIQLQHTTQETVSQTSIPDSDTPPIASIQQIGPNTRQSVRSFLSTSPGQRKLHRAVQELANGHPTLAIDFAVKALNGNYALWRSLCKEIALIPVDQQQALMVNRLVEDVGKRLEQQAAGNLRNECEALLFCTWYLNFVNEESFEAVTTWYTMGKVYENLLLLNARRAYIHAALNCYQHALNANNMQNGTLLVKMLLNKGNIYMHDVPFSLDPAFCAYNAIDCYKQALSLQARTRNNASGIDADLHHALGDAYRTLYQAQPHKSHLVQAQLAYEAALTIYPLLLQDQSTLRKQEEINSKIQQVLNERAGHRYQYNR